MTSLVYYIPTVRNPVTLPGHHAPRSTLSNGPLILVLSHILPTGSVVTPCSACSLSPLASNPTGKAYNRANSGSEWRGLTL